MLPFRIARDAMATRFELVLHGLDPIRLRAIGEEALDEIDRVENLLSRYRPHTDIGRINRLAAQAPVRVTPETFDLLKRARELSRLTEGAFDPTAGALIQAWGFCESTGRTPEPEALAAARRCVGWAHVEFDEDQVSLRFTQPGVSLDLGAIGKGYALDRAAAVIQEAGVGSALLHGGTSTILALGTPPGEDGWKVALASGPTDTSATGLPDEIVLNDESLSVSAPWGKWFLDEAGHPQGHVLDPRLGQPALVKGLAAVSAPSGADSDALSTALLVGGSALIPTIRLLPGVRCWVRP